MTERLMRGAEWERENPEPKEWAEWMKDSGRRVYATPKAENNARKKELANWQNEWRRIRDAHDQAYEDEQYKYMPRSYRLRDDLIKSGLSDDQVDLLTEYINELIREMAEANGVSG